MTRIVPCWLFLVSWPPKKDLTKATNAQLVFVEVIVMSLSALEDLAIMDVEVVVVADLVAVAADLVVVLVTGVDADTVATKVAPTVVPLDTPHLINILPRVVEETVTVQAATVVVVVAMALVDDSVVLDLVDVVVPIVFNLVVEVAVLTLLFPLSIRTTTKNSVIKLPPLLVLPAVTVAEDAVDVTRPINNPVAAPVIRTSVEEKLILLRDKIMVTKNNTTMTVPVIMKNSSSPMTTLSNAAMQLKSMPIGTLIATFDFKKTNIVNRVHKIVGDDDLDFLRIIIVVMGVGPYHCLWNLRFMNRLHYHVWMRGVNAEVLNVH